MSGRASPPAQSLAARLAERYTIERELGRGGMATVYLAADVRHGRRVALKVLDGDVAGTVGVDRFLREIRIAARLTHPHIVPLYDSGESEGVVFYVMPYIAGETLRDRLLRGTMALPDAARVAREVASALDYAHRQGVIHRDIKPDNILIAEGHAVVADFGIARALAEASLQPITTTGVVIGTPSYMSPEQASGYETALGGASDQYSLACVVYEMLSGRPPFTGGSAMSLIAQHMTAPPPPLDARDPVPESVQRAVQRALAKTPQERFDTASELARALDVDPARERRTSLELPAAVATRPGARLPVPLTPLMGREREVQSITNMLRQGARLLTLHGPGGIGKTRLALEVAQQASSHFSDGTWFVALAEVRDVDTLMARVAQAIGLRGLSATGQAVRDHLRDRNALLLLDNFEQIADVASAEVAQLLGDCPKLTALVTSQALLRVYGEHEFRVDPLRLPDGRQQDPGLIESSPAVKLFLQRAAAARPDFRLDAENAAAIAEICQRLDGVPLAIELAAARVRTTTPQALLPRLRNSLALLTGGARDVPERQRTMRGAIAWSHDMLSDAERVVFRRIAVFAGGVTAQSAARVCVEGDDVEASDVLGALADRSLLRRQIDAVGEPRFAMLRPVHAFASEMLDAAAERDAIADAHAVYFRALALEAEKHVRNGEDSWLDRLESDHDNLRRAMERLVEQGLIADAMRMAIALSPYWDARSYAREGVEQLRPAIERMTGDIPAPLRLTALFTAGVLADSCGDLALEKEFFERHLALTEAQGNPSAIAIAQSNLGIVKMRHGEYDAAVELFQMGTRAMREARNPQAMALGTANLGNAERMRGNFAAARTAYAEAKDVLEKIGDRVNVAWSLSHIADLSRDEGNVDEARAHYREALAIFVDLGHKRGMASILTDLGEMVAGQGEVLEARGLLQEALVQVADLGDQRAMLRVFEVLAQIASAQLQDERAVQLAGAVAGLRDLLGAPMSTADRDRLQSRVAASIFRMDGEARDRAWHRGVVMSIDEAVRYVTVPDPTTPVSPLSPTVPTPV